AVDSVLTLGDLAGADLRALIADRLGDAATPTAIAAVLARGGGNPLFVEELAQAVRDAGPRGEDVPASARDVVSARIDRLSPKAKTALRFAAVLGGAVRARLLEELLGEHSLERELDFRLEAASAQRMADAFVGDPRVRIPYVVPEFTRTRVLVTEYLPGIRVTDRARLERAGVDSGAVLDTLLDAYALQVFTHEFFHADPHPGNLLVLPGDGGAFQLCFVDFGIVQEVPKGFQAGVLALARSLLARDADGTAAALAELGLATRDPAARTIEQIAERLTTALRRADAEGFAAVVAELGNEIGGLLRDDPLATVPPHVFLLGRVLGLLSGVSAQLGVRVNLVRALLPRLFESR
ncbi:MAG: AarF/UbiB family protein, partial [bacterium]